jgi:uncharacterized membrane protein
MTFLALISPSASLSASLRAISPRAAVLTTAAVALALPLMVSACPTGPGPVDVDCEGDVPKFADVAAFETCVACHDSSKSGGARASAPVGIDFDTFDAAQANADEAANEVEAGTMPPGGGLSEQEKADLITWARCGTPE